MSDAGNPNGTSPVFRERGEFQRLRGRYPGYTRARLAQFARRLKRTIYPARERAERIELAGPTERIG